VIVDIFRLVKKAGKLVGINDPEKIFFYNHSIDFFFRVAVKLGQKKFTILASIAEDTPEL
jgi:hypothetical protein